MARFCLVAFAAREFEVGRDCLGKGVPICCLVSPRDLVPGYPVRHISGAPPNNNLHSYRLSTVQQVLWINPAIHLLRSTPRTG
jgi:hypothetical protein